MAFITTGVPRWRRPETEEPAHGLFLHLVELNGYSSVDLVAECLGVAVPSLRSGKRSALTAFAQAIRCPIDLLALNSPVELPREQRTERKYNSGSVSMTMRGVAIGTLELNRKHRRVCPACLSEARHHRFWWDLDAITTCPRHKLRLLDRCGCGNEDRLTWKDTRIFYCARCSRDLPAQSETADPGVLSAEMQLLKRFGVIEAPPCAGLDGLSYCDAVDMMQRVGAAKLGGFSTKWQSAASLALDPALVRARGYEIIASGEFTSLFDELLAGFKRAKPDIEPGFTTAYGWFYHWFNLRGGRRFSEFLSDALIAHARANFHIIGSVATGLTDDGGLPATYTLEQAARVCGISKTSMRKFGVQMGKIRKEARSGRVLVFEGDALRLLAKDLREGMDKNGVMEQLGVDLRVTEELLLAGLITPLFKDRRWRNSFVFRRRELDDLIRKICGDSPLVHDIPDGMISASKARRSLNMSGGFFLKLIADGRVKAVARLSGSVGVSGALVDENELRLAVMNLVGSMDLPITLAAAVLTTTNRVVKALLARGLLRSRQTKGGQLVAAASLAEFRKKYIGVTELAKLGNCRIERVRRCLTFMRIKPISALVRCSFPGVSRPEIENRLGEFRSLLVSGLRSVKVTSRREGVA
ncbi:hypothetical protein XI06_05525 [Bradyrhizobium sp. CCBAU 11434]|nr:hypothetical protein [Bradyrhizobium sp. CCBAU 11434]